MNDFAQSVATALSLIGRLDSELVAIVWLSLRVSLSASLIALVIGAPLGILLAISRFRGRQVLIVLANALLVVLILRKPEATPVAEPVRIDAPAPSPPAATSLPKPMSNRARRRAKPPRSPGMRVRFQPHASRRRSGRKSRPRTG